VRHNLHDNVSQNFKRQKPLFKSRRNSVAGLFNFVTHSIEKETVKIRRLSLCQEKSGNLLRPRNGRRQSEVSNKKGWALIKENFVKKVINIFFNQ
jgi:hypothetical protein